MTPTDETGPARGYLYIVLAAIFWAASGSASKYLFLNGVTPFQVAQQRVTISVAVLLVWLAVRSPQRLKIARRDWGYFLVLGTFGMAAVQITYLFAISRIHVAAAILLQYLAPMLIAIYTAVFLRERLSAATVAAVCGATIGCYLVVGAYNLDLLTLKLSGIVSGVLSAVAFAFWSVHGEYGMHRYNPWTVLFFALAVAAVEWNILHPPLEALLHAYTPLMWALILYVAVMGTLVPFGLYYEGINRVRATRASITATLEPISAGVISWIFLEEAMAPLQVAGAALVILAVILLQLKQERDDRAPAMIRGNTGRTSNSDGPVKSGRE